MKINHNGKRYDTAKCTILGESDLYSYSNNYAGTCYLGIASDGQYIQWQDTNGQDCYITDDISILTRSEAVDLINSMDQDDDQVAAAIKCGLIEVID